MLTVKNDNIKWCYNFPLHIFCVIIYVIIFRVLSFMLSFDVIIFHGKQMLSFLCYHFPLYIFCVIIYGIIWCYHLLLSFPLFFLFPETLTHFYCTHIICLIYVVYKGVTEMGVIFLLGVPIETPWLQGEHPQLQAEVDGSRMNRIEQNRLDLFPSTFAYSVLHCLNLGSLKTIKIVS